jgi:hypothetical protein
MAAKMRFLRKSVYNYGGFRAQRGQKRLNDLRYRHGFCGLLVQVAGFKAEVKEMTGHVFFCYFFTSAALSGQADKIPLVSLCKDFDILNPVRRAFYTVTFHYMDSFFINIGGYETPLEVFVEVF